MEISHFCIRFDMAHDCHHHFVIDPASQVQVVWHTLNSKRVRQGNQSENVTVNQHR